MNAEEICKNVNPKVKEQAVTLAKAVLAMQKKIETELETYDELPLAQMLTTTQGEKALKANPALAEFRSTVRDYSAALNALQALINNNKKTEAVVSLDDFRKPLKVVMK